MEGQRGQEVQYQMVRQSLEPGTTEQEDGIVDLDSVLQDPGHRQSGAQSNTAPTPTGTPQPLTPAERPWEFKSSGAASGSGRWDPDYFDNLRTSDDQVPLAEHIPPDFLDSNGATD